MVARVDSAWLCLVALGGLLAVGCGEEGGSKVCTQVRDRFEQCSEGRLPRSALTSSYRRCVVAMAYRPEPGDTPGNLAEQERTTFATCAAEASCDGFHRCFEERGCRFVLTGPTDLTPTLECLGPVRSDRTRPAAGTD